jgi:carboxyl-terminal processing protease
MNKVLKVFLVTVLEILLFLPAVLDQKVDRGLRTFDEYWADSGLQSTELESLLAIDVCNADKLSYLSCINSISQMAEKKGFALNEQGQFEKLTRENIEKRMTEKTELAIWANQFEQNQMLSAAKIIELWHQLRAKTSEKELPALIAAGINGYLSIARDPHSYIIPLQFYEEVLAKSDSKSTNLGFVARRNKDIAIIRKLFTGSPAETAGLKKGDRILRMNGMEISAMLNTQFSDMLKVKEGDRLSLLVSRNVNGKSVEKYMEIIKTDFTTPSVEHSLREGQKNLGIITLHKFAKDTCQQTESALKNLMQQNVSGLLLDLRDNPGGQVEEAACILNLFLGKGQLLFETRYLDPLRSADRYVSDKAALYTGPLAVLINSGSASASEIVAGSLKDHKRATLVGERTFGKGSFQDGKIWGNYQKIAVFETEGMYYFPSGWTPQLIGIEPDLQVKFAITDFQREEDLFYRPLRPKDLWVGPQTISWLQMMQCPESSTLWSDLGFESEDAQMTKAFEWLKCRPDKVGVLNDPN